MTLTEPTLRSVPGYGRLWWASSVSDFGTYVTQVAIQVLIVTNLHGSAADVGLVSSGRWLPYMLFGVVMGVYIDRLRRRPVMIVADLVRGALLLAIPAMALGHLLSVWVLAGFMAVFGFFSLAGDAAAQAFLPRLVPVGLLTRAHARIDQSAAVAQSSGPALSGGLVGLIGAPFAVIIDAVSYVFSALMLLGIRVEEPAPAPAAKGSLWPDVREGLAFVYRHPTLTPFAIGTHGWFVFSGIAGAVTVVFVLKTLGLPPLAWGVLGSAAGVGSLAGASAAARLGDRFGAGRVVIASRWLCGAAFAPMALAPAGWAGMPLLVLGQALFGVALGISNANEMGYRQSVTPDRLQGRMNVTMRSINRAMVVVAAPLGGLLADAIGTRATLWIVAVGFAAGALLLGLSRFADARIETVGPA